MVWHPPGIVVDRELLETLAKKNVYISARATSEFAAFAQVTLDCRGIAEGVVGASMLLVVEPRRVPAAGDVWRLIHRHGMRTVVWAFDSASSPRLRPYEPAPTPFESAQPKPLFGSPSPATGANVAARAVSASRVPIGPPKLRLAGEGSEAAAGVAKASPSLLSDAELAMLLSDEPLRGR